MILLFPWAKKLRNGKTNPKNYPFWKDVVKLLSHKYHLVQCGVEGEEQLVPDFRKNLKLKQMDELMDQCQTWVSVDSFGQHLGWDRNKKGVAIWGQSDPLIFGHPENINLLKNRSFLREQQFWWWEQCEYKLDAFVGPAAVVNAVKTLL